MTNTLPYSTHSMESMYYNIVPSITSEKIISQKLKVGDVGYVIIKKEDAYSETECHS